MEVEKVEGGVGGERGHGRERERKRAREHVHYGPPGAERKETGCLH